MPDQYPFRVLLVAAVSKPGQAKADKLSIPLQLARGREFCAARGWPIVKEIVIPGKSRYLEYLEDLLAKSPEFREIIQWIKSGRIDLIWIIRGDRLFRTQELQQDIRRICRRHNVQIYAADNPKEPMLPTDYKVTALDKFLENVDGFRAEDEIEKFRARVYDKKMARVTAKGLAGSSWVPFGYKRNPEPGKPYLICEPEAIWVRYAYRRRLDGVGYNTLARELNERGVRGRTGRPWTRVTVSRLLHNEFYAGYVFWGQARAQGIHEPIIDLATWQAVQSINERRRSAAPPTASPRELTGLVRCAVCGAYMTHHRRERKTIGEAVYLICGSYSHSYEGQPLPVPRHRNGHTAAVVEQYVMEQVIHWLSDPDAFLEMLHSQRQDITSADLQAMDRQIQEREQQKTRWLDAYGEGVISLSELRERRQQVETDLVKLRAEREDLAGRVALTEQLGEQVEELAELVRYIPAMPPQERRAIYQRLIQTVWLEQGKEPRIEWR